jgi:hypothetical protein
MKWQPIETAPKDGTRVLAYWPDVLANNSATQVESWYGPRGHEQMLLTWQSGEMQLVWQSAFEWADGPNAPTHWMPLPEPPEDV